MIEEVKSPKLLGMKLDNDQKWTSHFWGKGGLLNSPNQRLFMKIRISPHIPRDKLKLIANSI